ncbi:MAG: T9SS type A sorting domain-containing protein [Bacteroidetes bacterium]|nr:T9SS type A sorting domain-containing protein [Bacteroidota bacterium]
MYSPLISFKFSKALLAELALFKLIFAVFCMQTHASTDLRFFSKEATAKRTVKTERNAIENDYPKSNTKQDNYALPIIRLGHEGEEGFHRQLLIAFEPNSTDGVDNGYDSLMLDTFSTDAYWLIENRSYVIQGRPFRLDLVVDIGVVSAFDQVHTFMIDALEDYTGEVFLFDNLTGQIHNLKQQAATVSVGSGTFNDRLKLVFTSETLSGSDLLTNTAAVGGYFDSEEGIFKIFRNQTSDVRSIKIFSISGKIIIHQNIQSKGHLVEISIPFSTASSGIYIAKIQTASSTSTIKFVKY